VQRAMVIPSCFNSRHIFRAPEIPPPLFRSENTAEHQHLSICAPT
jgi:hypothetical protein